MTHRVCAHCGASFAPRTTEQRCCSKSCAGFMRGQSLIPCAHCGTLFKPKLTKLREGKGRFCSAPCKDKSQRIHVTPAFIEANSIPVPFSGCWIWQGTLDGDGYGTVGGRRLRVRVHRASLEFKLGRKLTHSEVTRHSCDIRSCVNPDHLEPGSPVDNNHDCTMRLRRRRGEAHPQSKLTTKQVTAIRACLEQGALQKDVASEFGVSPALISQIACGRAWHSRAIEALAAA